MNSQHYFLEFLPRPTPFYTDLSYDRIEFLFKRYFRQMSRNTFSLSQNFSFQRFTSKRQKLYLVILLLDLNCKFSESRYGGKCCVRDLTLQSKSLTALSPKNKLFLDLRNGQIGKVRKGQNKISSSSRNNFVVLVKQLADICWGNYKVRVRPLTF